jgi:anti-anti-sigma factor
MTATQPVLVIARDLDVFSSSKMRDSLAELKEPATIDLTQVRHLDAAALGVLAAAARNVGIGKLTIIVPRGNLARLMKMVGFMNLARVITDRRETSAPGYRLARRRTDRAAQNHALETAGAA